MTNLPKNPEQVADSVQRLREAVAIYRDASQALAGKPEGEIDLDTLKEWYTITERAADAFAELQQLIWNAMIEFDDVEMLRTAVSQPGAGAVDVDGQRAIELVRRYRRDIPPFDSSAAPFVRFLTQWERDCRCAAPHRRERRWLVV